MKNAVFVFPFFDIEYKIEMSPRRRIRAPKCMKYFQSERVHIRLNVGYAFFQLLRLCVHSFTEWRLVVTQNENIVHTW